MDPTFLSTFGLPLPLDPQKVIKQPRCNLAGLYPGRMQAPAVEKWLWHVSLAGQGRQDVTAKSPSAVPAVGAA